MICPKCNSNQPDGSKFCQGCGYDFSQSSGEPANPVPPVQGGPSAPPPPNNQYGGNQYGNNPYGQGGPNPYNNNYQPPYNPPPSQGGDVAGAESKSTIALVMGILSIVMGGTLWTILAIVFGVMSMKTLKANNRPITKSIVGIVLGAVGFIIWIGIFIWIASFVSAATKIVTNPWGF
jgi:hypothetical protein